MTPETILSICSDVLNIPEAEIKGKSRKSKVVIARHIYCYIAYHKTETVSEKVGLVINRDHSTVIHALKKISGFLDVKDITVTSQYNKIIKEMVVKHYNSLVVQDVNLLNLSQNYTKSFVNL
jgi:chromosomal replication initiation ATPase DnaA